MNRFLISGVVMIFAAACVWLSLFWRLVHPNWVPVRINLSTEPSAVLTTNFTANTAGSYFIQVRCRRLGVPSELAAHFEDWRVPGDIHFQGFIEVRSMNAVLLSKTVEQLVPAASNRDFLSYSLGEFHLANSARLSLSLRSNSGLPQLLNASPTVEVHLSPLLLKTRMMWEIIGRVIASAVTVGGLSLIIVGIWMHHKSRKTLTTSTLHGDG